MRGDMKDVQETFKKPLLVTCQCWGGGSDFRAGAIKILGFMRIHADGTLSFIRSKQLNLLTLE